MNHRFYIGGLCTGVLLALAYPPFSLADLAWVAFLPLLWDLSRAKSWREAGIVSAGAGAVFFLASCYWVGYVSVLGAIGLCLYLGLFFVPFGLFVHRYYRDGMSAILWGSVACVASEFLRGTLLTGLPWNTLASSQARFISLIQMASVTGAYGVSFLVILANLLLFELVLRLQGKRFRLSGWLTIAGLALLASAIGFGILELRQADAANPAERVQVNIAAVQPNIPQEIKWDPAHRAHILRRLQDLTRQAARAKPALIVWPETCVPGELRHDALLMQFAKDLAGEAGCPLLIGSQDSTNKTPKKYFNAAILVSPQGEIVQTYQKMHLVPYGEFLPGARWLPFFRWFIPIPEDFSPGKEQTVFSLQGPTFRWAEQDGTLRSVTDMIRFGVMICFEDIFSDPFRRTCFQRMSFMVNMTNDAWFGHSGAAEQHANLAVFRCVENRVPLLRATNTGYTCFIDAYGRVRQEVREHGSIFVPGVLNAQFVPAYKKTIFSETGDFFAHACLILAILKIFLLRKERKKQWPIR